MLTIYHNPRCRKSRETLNLIDKAGEKVTIVEYLQTPPGADELKNLVKKLNLPVENIIRKNESIYKENFKGKNIDEEEWYSILSENPKLIERPIVVKGNSAILGRPPENVLELMK